MYIYIYVYIHIGLTFRCDVRVPEMSAHGLRTFSQLDLTTWLYGWSFLQDATTTTTTASNIRNSQRHSVSSQFVLPFPVTWGLSIWPWYSPNSIGNYTCHLRIPMHGNSQWPWKLPTTLGVPNVSENSECPSEFPMSVGFPHVIGNAKFSKVRKLTRLSQTATRTRCRNSLFEAL
jgi:hypothetical protein